MLISIKIIKNMCEINYVIHNLSIKNINFKNELMFCKTNKK